MSISTPSFQGSDKAQWVESGKQFPSFFLLKPTGAVLNESEEGSDTLVKLGVAFPKWLLHQAEKAETKVKIMCFFEQPGTSVGGTPIGKVCRL